MKLLPNAVFCLACIMMLAFLFLLLSGCDDTAAAKHDADYKPHVVKLWSGAKTVGEWRSNDRPESHREYGNRTSILAFVDSETGTYVMLRGTISVEQTE